MDDAVHQTEGGPMATLTDIRGFPTSIRTNDRTAHESVLRAYQVLEKVKDLLRRQTPADVVLEIIADLSSGEQTTAEIGDRPFGGSRGRVA